MSDGTAWAQGYALQAGADLNTWFVLQTVTDVAECHRLLFLQMACEKACKAHLILGGSSPETLQTSHGYVANPLTIVIKQQILRLSASLKGMRGVMEHVRHVAEEIEILNPAIDRAGKRPDNCEYPWEDSSGAVRSPLTWSFHPSRLVTAPAGRTFLKLLRASIEQLCDFLSTPETLSPLRVKS